MKHLFKLSGYYNHLHGLIFELKERMNSRQDRPVMLRVYIIVYWNIYDIIMTTNTVSLTQRNSEACLRSIRRIFGSAKDSTLLIERIRELKRARSKYIEFLVRRYWVYGVLHPARS